MYIGTYPAAVLQRLVRHDLCPWWAHNLVQWVVPWMPGRGYLEGCVEQDFEAMVFLKGKMCHACHTHREETVVLATPGLQGEKIWKWIISVLETSHSSPLDAVASFNNSNSCWHLLGTYVPGPALNILRVLTHRIRTAPYRVGAITVPILLTGKMSHREANSRIRFTEITGGREGVQIQAVWPQSPDCTLCSPVGAERELGTLTSSCFRNMSHLRVCHS